MNETQEHICEYCDCMNKASIYDENLEAWLCETHAYSTYNFTGYCSKECQLGYGCDQTC